MPINGAVLPCPAFLSWAKKIFNYIHSFPGQVIHFVFGTCSRVYDLTRVLSKGRGIEEKKDFQFESAASQVKPMAKIFSSTQRSC